MAKRNRLQELFEVERLLEPDGMAETERAELPEISTTDLSPATDLSPTDRATPAAPPSVDPVPPSRPRPGGHTRRIDARSELADVSDTPVPLSSIEVTRERTIGFDDELHEQSTEGGLEYQRPARALGSPTVQSPRAEDTAPRNVELDGHGMAEETGPQRASAPPPAALLPGASVPPPPTVGSGLAKQAGLVSAAALLLGLVTGLLVRAPGPDAEVVVAGQASPPPQPEARLVAQPPAERVSNVEQPDIVAETVEETRPDAGKSLSSPPPKPRPRRRGRPRASSPPTAVDTTSDAEAKFRVLEKRRRRMLRARSLGRSDLAKLGVSSELIVKWTRAREAKNIELGEQALRELEAELARAIIDRTFLEYRLKRVLTRTRAWAARHPNDVETSRAWESRYFELRKALLNPTLAPNSRAATDLLAQIDALEREITSVR